MLYHQLQLACDLRDPLLILDFKLEPQIWGGNTTAKDVPCSVTQRKGRTTVAQFRLQRRAVVQANIPKSKLQSLLCDFLNMSLHASVSLSLSLSVVSAKFGRFSETRFLRIQARHPKKTKMRMGAAEKCILDIF